MSLAARLELTIINRELFGAFDILAQFLQALDPMQDSNISSRHLAVLLEQFLADAPQAVAIEDGEHCSTSRPPSIPYRAKVSASCTCGRRSVTSCGGCSDAEVQGRTLRLQVLRFGQSQPNLLEICGDRDPRQRRSQAADPHSIPKAARRVIRREYPGFHLDQLSSAPIWSTPQPGVHPRMLRAGQSLFALLGQGQTKLSRRGCAALTFGILWMDYQRQQLAGRAQVEGLKLFLPPGRSEIVRQRAANLDPEAAKWQTLRTR